MISCGYRTIFRLSSSFPVNPSPFLSLSSGTFHRLSKISSFSCIFLGKFNLSIFLNHFSNICFFTIQTQFHPQNKKFPKSNLVFSQIVFSRIHIYFFHFFIKLTIHIPSYILYYHFNRYISIEIHQFSQNLPIRIRGRW